MVQICLHPSYYLPMGEVAVTLLHRWSDQERDRRINYWAAGCFYIGSYILYHPHEQQPDNNQTTFSFRCHTSTCDAYMNGIIQQHMHVFSFWKKKENGKTREWGEAPGIQQRTNWWGHGHSTSNNEIPCPTGANNLGNAWREWSRQCHLCLTFFFSSLSGEALGLGGCAGSVGSPWAISHGRPHEAHCLQRSGHSTERRSLKLWRGRTLCSVRHHGRLALNRSCSCACTFKAIVAVAGEQCNPWAETMCL